MDRSSFHVSSAYVLTHVHTCSQPQFQQLKKPTLHFFDVFHHIKRWAAEHSASITIARQERIHCISLDWNYFVEFDPRHNHRKNCGEIQSRLIADECNPPNVYNSESGIVLPGVAHVSRRHEVSFAQINRFRQPTEHFILQDARVEASRPANGDPFLVFK